MGRLGNRGALLAIHLLSRRRARRLAFAAVEFILRSRKQKVRHIRLKQLLLLALRTLVVAALAFAIARPLFKAPAASAAAAGPRSAVAIVLDASLSMRYRVGSKSVFERAQDEAKSLVEGLPSESPVTLVACDGHTPEVEPPVRSRRGEERNRRCFSHFPNPPTSRAAWPPRRARSARARSRGRKSRRHGPHHPSLQLGAPPPRVTTPKGEVTPEIVFVDAAREKLPNISVADVAGSLERRARERPPVRRDPRLLAETDQRAAELAIITSVQEGLAAELDMQAMYDLVGDKIHEIFDAQVVDIGDLRPAGRA